MKYVNLNSETVVVEGDEVDGSGRVRRPLSLDSLHLMVMQMHERARKAEADAEKTRVILCKTIDALHQLTEKTVARLEEIDKTFAEMGMSYPGSDEEG